MTRESNRDAEQNAGLKRKNIATALALFAVAVGFYVAIFLAVSAS